MSKKNQNDSYESSENSSEESEQEITTNSDEGYNESFEDVEEEEDTTNLEEVSNKRKLNDEKAPYDKRKKHKREVKPPTAEEMIRLKETENLFQSNLFRLQIEEMIGELKPRKTDKSSIKRWMLNFKQFLLELEDSNEIKVKGLKHVAEKIVVPLPKRDWESKNTIKFYKPLDVKIIGPYANGTVAGPHFVLDVALIIPKKYFQKEDHLNQTFHYKRAIYLSIIASHLQQSELIDHNFEMNFWLKDGDLLRPVLLFRPAGKMTQFVEVAVNILLEENPFKLNRFLPEKNNLRPEWWGFERESEILPPTPNYNMSILEDIVALKNEQLKMEIFESNQNLKDAAILLSVWLKQRGLLEGLGAFNTHLLSMFIVYLVKNHKINNHMSSYQIIRNVWLALAQTNWTKKALSLCTSKESVVPSEMFLKFFDVAFIDCTGHYNMCCRLNKTIYLRVKKEAEKAIQFLNDTNMNSFQALFMINMPFLHQYDHVISFTDPSTISRTVSKKFNDGKLMNFSGDELPLFIQLITNTLSEGLGNRLSYLSIHPVSLPKWKIDEDGPKTLLNDILMFGLKLNPESALSIIEKGPEANSEQAAQFREFWSDKCELRRFRDGTVCESVCWHDSNATLSDRRLIVKKIVEYLLKNKLNITTKAYNYIADQLHDLVVNKFKPDSSNEEASQAVHKVYEKLSQQLRDLTDIPLSIVSVRCISPVYRFTDIFPPVPATYTFNKKICTISKNMVIFKSAQDFNSLPFYVEPIDLVLQMAMSQKWPDDVKAGKRLIAAFNIVIASSLKKNYDLNCHITTDYILVQQDGYIFRLHLGYSKEIALIKQQLSDEGVTFYRDTPQSILLEKKFINLPKVTGALYGLSQIYSGYGYATCLAKRWINSHMFDEFHFPSLVIELIMARLFISAQPYEVTLQPLPAFLRFLSYMATTNWHIDPIIVNFNNLLSREQIMEIEQTFQANRNTLPPLVLATPYDVGGTLWTKDAPTLPSLIRISKLAAVSLKMLDIFLITAPTQQNIMKIFDPPLSVFDAVIILHKDKLPRRLQTVAINWENRNKSNTNHLPIVDFDPAALYLQELREKYSEYALFFHDSYGGKVIGVIFKPSFLKEVEFKTSRVGPRVPSITDNKKIILQPSKEILINGFYILGEGLVHKIEIR